MITADNIEAAKGLGRDAKRIFVLTGAGVSAESGIPTFRGGGGAPVWRGLPFEQLSSARMVNENLPLVWEWFDYRRNIVGKCKPNAAHQALAKIQQSGRLEEFTLVTQNIDGLHQSAGAENVIELHGSLWRARCLSCKNNQDLREIPEDERPPVCPECSDSMRPDVILFGEAMPMKAVMEAQNEAQNCDLCIVIGTSVLVYPAAELPVIAKRAGAKIIEINPEQTPLSDQADVTLRGAAAEILPMVFSVVDAAEDVEILENASLENNKELNLSECKDAPKNSSAKGDFMTSRSHPLRADFIQSEEYPILNKLGLTFAPGKKQTGAISGNWDRDLATDLTRLRNDYHTDTLVSLVEESELAELGIHNLEYECRNHNIELIRFPLRDVSVPPSLKSFARLIREIIKLLKQKKTVVIHCKGGLGRAGLTAACSIVAGSNNKISGSDAIKIVRAARPGTVETMKQENFVSPFGKYWQLYIEHTEDILGQQKRRLKKKCWESRVKAAEQNCTDSKRETADGISVRKDQIWCLMKTILMKSLFGKPKLLSH